MQPDLKKPPQCRLEPIGPRHAEAMFDWMSSLELRDAVGIRGEPSLERTREWIERARSDPSIEGFAVICDERHVGNVVLDQIDTGISTARLSIYIGEPEDRAAGIGTAAVELVLDHAFGSLDLFKVWLTVHTDNGGAIAVYSRCGFEVEGVLRGEFLVGGERVDALRMAVERRNRGGR